MNRRIFSISGIAAIAGALTGCGGKKRAAVICESIAEETTQWLDSSITPGHQRTGDYVAVSLDGPHLDFYKTLWMVAANIDGQPAVWAIDTITADHGITLSVNPWAQEVSTWFHGDNVRYKVMPDDPGVARAIACLP